MKRSGTTIRCIGPSSTRTGTSCAPSVIRPGCARTTMRPTIASRRVSPRSASVAKRVTDKVRATSIGSISNRAGGRSASARTLPKGCWHGLTSATDITWLPDPQTGKPQRRIGPAILRKEVETCGLCHARRGEFSEDWVPGQWLSDTHVVSPTGARALSCRRADAGRGLQLRLVQAEPDVRRRRDLQRLPRSAQRQARGLWR